MQPLSYFIILAASVLVFIASCSAGHIHEKFIIHAPVKFETIHHYKVHKVPVYIKKHVHHHKYVNHHNHHFDHLPLHHEDHSLEFDHFPPHFSNNFASGETSDELYY